MGVRERDKGRERDRERVLVRAYNCVHRERCPFDCPWGQGERERERE